MDWLTILVIGAGIVALVVVAGAARKKSSGAKAEAASIRAFVCSVRPRSVNAKTAERYKALIQKAYAKYCAPCDLQPPQYGLVYYFHRRKTDLDADNISKPVWDALEGICYSDDSVLKHRRSGVIDLSSGGMEAIDLSRVPDPVAAQMLASLGSDEHVLYVELGVLRPKMFEFGIEEHYGN